MHELQVESNGSPQATTRSSRALNDEIRPFTDAKSQKTMGFTHWFVCASTDEKHRAKPPFNADGA